MKLKALWASLIAVFFVGQSVQAQEFDRWGNKQFFITTPEKLAFCEQVLQKQYVIVPGNPVYTDSTNIYTGTNTNNFGGSGQTLIIPLKITPASPSPGEIFVENENMVFADTWGDLHVVGSGGGTPALAENHIFVGNASSEATDVAMSGDATIVAAGTLTIANSAVTNAKMANMADQTVKGNVSGGSAAPSDLSKTQLTTLINTATDSLSGALPALTSAQIPVGQSGTVLAKTVTGDVTIAASGATTIKTDVALAGNPTTTTQAATNNSTRIATTAYVYDNLALPDPWTIVSFDTTLPIQAGAWYYPAPGEWLIHFSGKLDGAETANHYPFIYQNITGDFTFSARIVSQGPCTASFFQQTGLLCAESTAAGTKEFFVSAEFGNNGAYPGVRLYFVQRTTTNGATSSVATSDQSLPYWVRLVRSGTTISAWRSADGSSWTQIGTDQTLSLSDPVKLGFFGNTGYSGVSSYQTPGFATFTNVSLSQP